MSERCDEPERPADIPAPDGSFEIHLAWSEVTLVVAPEQTALAVLLAAGVPVEPGCMTGGCGSCATDYVGGDPEHRDVCLSLRERERMFCPCVTRARTRIVLPL